MTCYESPFSTRNLLGSKNIKEGPESVTLIKPSGTGNVLEEVIYLVQKDDLPEDQNKVADDTDSHRSVKPQCELPSASVVPRKDGNKNDNDLMEEILDEDYEVGKLEKKKEDGYNNNCRKDTRRSHKETVLRPLKPVFLRPGEIGKHVYVYINKNEDEDEEVDVGGDSDFEDQRDSGKELGESEDDGMEEELVQLPIVDPYEIYVSSSNASDKNDESRDTKRDLVTVEISDSDSNSVEEVDNTTKFEDFEKNTAESKTEEPSSSMDTDQGDTNRERDVDNLTSTPQENLSTHLKPEEKSNESFSNEKADESDNNHPVCDTEESSGNSLLNNKKITLKPLTLKDGIPFRKVLVRPNSGVMIGGVIKKIVTLKDLKSGSIPMKSILNSGMVKTIVKTREPPVAKEGVSAIKSLLKPVSDLKTTVENKQPQASVTAKSIDSNNVQLVIKDKNHSHLLVKKLATGIEKSESGGSNTQAIKPISMPVLVCKNPEKLGITVSKSVLKPLPPGNNPVIRSLLKTPPVANPNKVENKPLIKVNNDKLETRSLLKPVTNDSLKKVEVKPVIPLVPKDNSTKNTNLKPLVLPASFNKEKTEGRSLLKIANNGANEKLDLNATLECSIAELRGPSSGPLKILSGSKDKNTSQAHGKAESESAPSNESSRSPTLKTAICCPYCSSVFFKTAEQQLHIIVKHPEQATKIKSLQPPSSSSLLTTSPVTNQVPKPLSTPKQSPVPVGVDSGNIGMTVTPKQSGLVSSNPGNVRSLLLPKVVFKAGNVMTVLKKKEPTAVTSNNVDDGTIVLSDSDNNSDENDSVKVTHRQDGLFFSTSEILELERELKDRYNKCKKCNGGLSYLPSLRAHAKIHPPGTKSCEICKHGLAVIKSILNHLESHVDDSDIE